MVTERNNSHRKTIVLLKWNVNFLLTGTVDVHVIQMLLTGSLSELCATLQMNVKYSYSSSPFAFYLVYM